MMADGSHDENTNLVFFEFDDWKSKTKNENDWTKYLRFAHRFT